MTWLDEIREREQKATKGPWHYFYEGSGSHSVFQTGGDREIVSCETGLGLTDKSNIIWEQAASDCRFVAESREDIPNLLAYIDVLEKELNFYSHEANYESEEIVEFIGGYPRKEQVVPSVLIDGGSRAKEALSWRPE